VKRTALATMVEMSSVLSDNLWRDGDLRVTVKDEANLTLMHIDLTVTLAPAFWPSPKERKHP